MTDNIYNLPEYPCPRDVWDALKEETRPIVIYGMGNGADKLLRRFEKYGITVADVFASDGFVRGHSYAGFRVKSFSEIKAQYSDFVIVLSFASNKPDVMEMIRDIDSQYELYIPDMPIADESEYFDREFYNSHYEEIASAYSLFEDEESKRIFSSVIKYRLFGRLSHLLDATSDKDEMYALIGKKKIETILDAGAYNGDTAREAIGYFPKLKKIYAIEPDRRNFKKLATFAETSEVEIHPINAAVWRECGEGLFSGSANRNSSVSATASYEHKKEDISLVTVDSIARDRIDYLKYDVEGAEYEALRGSCHTIEKSRPALLISLYHRSRDIFFLPLYISEGFGDYKLYLRRLPSIPAWEPSRPCISTLIPSSAVPSPT